MKPTQIKPKGAHIISARLHVRPLAIVKQIHRSKHGSTMRIASLVPLSAVGLITGNMEVL
jgi:hypothetical protein